MAKNSREGNQSRKKRYYEALAERGIRPVQVLAPESAHPLIRQAATLMTRDEAPLEPRAALRRAGGANEPEPVGASPTWVRNWKPPKPGSRKSSVRQKRGWRL